MASLTQLELLLPELRAYARSITSDVGEVDDLVQDAFERALRSNSQPNLLAELRPWMFRTIRNLFYDELRKRRVRREYSEGLGRLSHEATQYHDDTKDIVIRLTFEKLPPEAREILFLIDIMGMKYSQAADVIGVPNGTVMSRISRARRALVELMEGADAGHKDQKE